MKKADSQRIVIDASIARAAGGESAEFPASKNSRDFLVAVLKICHHAVMTPEIRDEWDRHQSRFAREWRTSMVARKKLFYLQSLPQAHEATRAALVELVRNSNLTDKQQSAIEKDLHLVAAALATDLRVATNDEVLRKLVKNLADRAPALKPVVWVNPTLADDKANEWLANGAPEEPLRRLGA